ncbi:MAG TPA: toll/interleukin-1 receptor domain-containing protein [Pyrinomonadaceae bacterium]|nr:toll/interleukin-1 receptor domain-containing protein [Pyrinomonadaceae bacterium]
MTEFHVFLSYTSREEEVKRIKPLIEVYCRDLWEWAQSKGVEIFYDDFTMEKRLYSASELEKILGDAVHKSHLMTAFLSPEYAGSEWCRFEYLETRKSRKPVVHAILWKMFRLDILPYSPEAQYLMPEEETDVMYLQVNPTPTKLKQAARECVEDSIRLIRRYYWI